MTDGEREEDAASKRMAIIVRRSMGHKRREKEECVFRWYLLGVKREHRACSSF